MHEHPPDVRHASLRRVFHTLLNNLGPMLDRLRPVLSSFLKDP
jgi:hypothetical protein